MNSNHHRKTQLHQKQLIPRTPVATPKKVYIRPRKKSQLFIGISIFLIITIALAGGLGAYILLNRPKVETKIVENQPVQNIFGDFQPRSSLFAQINDKPPTPTMIPPTPSLDKIFKLRATPTMTPQPISPTTIPKSTPTPGENVTSFTATLQSAHTSTPQVNGKIFITLDKTPNNWNFVITSGTISGLEKNQSYQLRICDDTDCKLTLPTAKFKTNSQAFGVIPTLIIKSPPFKTNIVAIAIFSDNATINTCSYSSINATPCASSTIDIKP